MSPRLSFNRLALYIKKGSAGAIPNDIIVQYLWPLLSHPHQGRLNKNIGDMNRCIKQLPRRTTNVIGPKVIYQLLHKPADYNEEHQAPFPRASVKFVYSLQPLSFKRRRYPQRYINIIEYILLNDKAFEEPPEMRDPVVPSLPKGTSYIACKGYSHFTEVIRQWYLLPSTFIENVVYPFDPRFTWEATGTG